MIYRVNGRDLDTASMEVSADGAVIAVEPKVFDLLRLLVENHGRTISRDEIIANVWNGRIISDATISARMNAARKAIGDDGERQTVIKTVPKRGYRVVAKVEVAAFYKGIAIPENDADRVNALRTYDILDTPPEPAYDDITAMAARVSDCRHAYISFCDEKRFWLKSKVGYPDEFSERPRELAMCPATLLQSDLMIIEDMRKHPGYRDLPSVKKPQGTRFYCAMPLINPEGYALGTLCVWDSERKRLDEDQKTSIRTLARQVLTLLEMRRRITELELRHREFAQLVARMSSMMRL